MPQKAKDSSSKPLEFSRGFGLLLGLGKVWGKGRTKKPRLMRTNQGGHVSCVHKDTTSIHPRRLRNRTSKWWFGSDDFSFSRGPVFSGSMLIFRGVYVTNISVCLHVESVLLLTNWHHLQGQNVVKCQKLHQQKKNSVAWWNRLYDRVKQFLHVRLEVNQDWYCWWKKSYITWDL